MAGVLYLGSRRYSSWSLRGWLAVRLAGLAVEERVIPLKGGGKTTEIHALSPNKLVPYLCHEDAQIWESLAICAYCAEWEPSLWPQDRSARAQAWSISAQMHAGFHALRQACPMDLDRSPAPLTEMSDALRADIALLNRTLEAALTRDGRATPYLFGPHPGVADCLYAPVALRIHLYKLDVTPVLRRWVTLILSHELMTLWCDLAAEEPESWKLNYARPPSPL